MVIILSMDEAEPALLEAVMVWLLSPIAMGIPEIEPSAPNIIPNGREGDDPHSSGVPPVNEGVSKWHVSPLVQFSVFSCSSIEAISGGRTVISNLNDDTPIELDAMIVYDLDGDSWFGAPDITPESWSIEIPSGNEGLTAQELGASPRKLGVNCWNSVPISSIRLDSPKSSISGLIMVRQISPVKTCC